MANKHIHVTFKDSANVLVAMFTTPFTSEKEAKMAIEDDAKWWLHRHGKVSGCWIKPDDYYLAVGKDGHTCVWQYFECK